MIAYGSRERVDHPLNAIIKLMETVETEKHDHEFLSTPPKRRLPLRRMFMLSSLLFFVGYSYAINEGFGIPLLLEAGLSERYAPIIFGLSSIVSVFVGEYLDTQVTDVLVYWDEEDHILSD